MDVECPKCHETFKVKVESNIAGGKARAKLWTFEQRSKSMKEAWKRRREKALNDEKKPTS